MIGMCIIYAAFLDLALYRSLLSCVAPLSKLESLIQLEGRGRNSGIKVIFVAVPLSFKSRDNLSNCSGHVHPVRIILKRISTMYDGELSKLLVRKLRKIEVSMRSETINLFA